MPWDWFTVPVTGGLLMIIIGIQAGRTGAVVDLTIGGGHEQHAAEVVLENEVEIGPDGTVEIEIDTALAKAIHGDIDHKYSITARSEMNHEERLLEVDQFW